MNNKSSGGVGFCGVLTIVFVVLKLVGVINWSWVWVLSPIWIDVLLLLVCLGIISICNNRMAPRHSRGTGRDKWKF